MYVCQVHKSIFSSHFPDLFFIPKNKTLNKHHFFLKQVSFSQSEERLLPSPSSRSSLLCWLRSSIVLMEGNKNLTQYSDGRKPVERAGNWFLTKRIFSVNYALPPGSKKETTPSLYVRKIFSDCKKILLAN